MTSSQPGPSKITAASFEEFNASLQGAALKATKHALSLPADLAFHRSIDPELSRELEAASARVLSITNNLLTLVSSTRGKGKLKLECQDDVMDSFQSLVVDAMDQLLEKAVRCPKCYEDWYADLEHRTWVLITI
jgi:exosome complex exonuclease RRP6